MKRGYLLITLLVLLCDLLFVIANTDSNSFVVSSTEPAKDGAKEDADTNSNLNPQIYSMQIQANVSNRFTRTLVTSKVRNLKKVAEESTFSVILPENAFISEFEMEIEGKVYKAYVKEKEEAKQIYQAAVSRGQSAAHVELSARDSKTFTVSVNIEPESKTIFRLVYEELLQRQNGQYDLVINIHPGQLVEDLAVEVHINESRPLTFVKTPSLRTGNEISKNKENLDPSAEIDLINNKTAIVKFHPDKNQQRKFAENLGSEKENGLSGQFVVQYDVDRDPQGGEVLLRDGYFVHFFAPSELQPLPKHIVFVLDHSGSMSGRKLDQLIDAMQKILPHLRPEDLFNIIRFADDASVWNTAENKFNTILFNSSVEYGHLEPHLRESNLPEAVVATKENINKAKDIVTDKSELGMTNMIAGLEVGLFLIKRTQEKFPDKYQPMIVFLTDGFPNVGLRSGDQITETVTQLNSGKNRAAIFSLSFGYGADKDFLRKLSSRNLGLSRHIYEAADASLQLQDFYVKISSPLLSDVSFQYVDGVSEVTRARYPILFNGSELVVAGRIENGQDGILNVKAICPTGPIIFNTTRTEPVSSLERLWAYLTVKEMLKKAEIATNKTELNKKSLELALKYSFVTAVTSLVVVKPNETHSVDSNAAQPQRGRRLSNSRLSHIPSTSRLSLSAPNYSPMRGLMGLPGPGYSARSGASYTIPLHLGRPNFDSGDIKRFYQIAPTVSPYFPKMSIPPPAAQNATTPQWLIDIKKNNEDITTPQGLFKLGKSGDVVTHPECLKTPLNGTGVCTIIFDCPEVLPLLKDINVYLKYFCPLNEYAGVCCPTTRTTAVEP